MATDSTTGTLRSDQRLAFSDEVLVRRVDDELVLLDLDTERYFSVDGPAAQFLDRLESLATVQQGAAALVDEYDIDEATLVEDLTGLASSLIDAGLLRVAL